MKPTAAPARFPYVEHRTMAEVMRDDRDSDLRRAMHTDRIRQDAHTILTHFKERRKAG